VKRRIVATIAAFIALTSRVARADPEERVPTDDPTGGAFSSPTLLFIPAAALPAWNVRVTLLSEFQSPYQTTDAPRPDAGIRPGGSVELGLPAGFVIAAGTNWVRPMRTPSCTPTRSFA
jgi:hypothetical protein